MTWVLYGRFCQSGGHCETVSGEFADDDYSGAQKMLDSAYRSYAGWIVDVKPTITKKVISPPQVNLTLSFEDEFRAGVKNGRLILNEVDYQLGELTSRTFTFDKGTSVRIIAQAPLDWQILPDLTRFADFTVTLDSDYSTTFLLRKTEAPPPEPALPGFWERLKDLLNSALQAIGKFLTNKVIEALNRLHIVLFNTDIDEETAKAWAGNIPGFNAMHVYAFGTDLDDIVVPELPDLSHVDLAIAVMPLPVGPAASFSAKMFARGGKTLTQKFMRKIAEQEAAIIGKGWSKTILGKYVQQEMLRQAARDIISSKPVWQQILTLQGPVAKWTIFAAGLMSIDLWATWAVTDNLSTIVNIDAKRFKTMVQNGEITKEEALRRLAELKLLFDKGKQFVDASKAVNPLIMFLGEPFVLATDAAALDIENTIRDIEALVVVPPPSEKAALSVTSTPTQARIYVDDIYLFEMTPTEIKVSPGHHKITVKKTGFNDMSTEDDFAAGVSYSKDFIMSEIAPPPIVPPIIPPIVPPIIPPIIPPIEPPITPPAPAPPSREIILPITPEPLIYNAWKVTIKAVDAVTGEGVFAAILINDIYMNRYTPSYFYFQPSAEYKITLRKQGYMKAELTFTTEPLPA